MVDHEKKFEILLTKSCVPNDYIIGKIVEKELNLTILFEDNIERLFIVNVDQNPLKVIKSHERHQDVFLEIDT